MCDLGPVHVAAAVGNREAILSAIECDGDCDTNAAIIGDIVCAYSGSAPIPADWLHAREPLLT